MILLIRYLSVFYQNLINYVDYSDCHQVTIGHFEPTMSKTKISYLWSKVKMNIVAYEISSNVILWKYSIFEILHLSNYFFVCESFLSKTITEIVLVILQNWIMVRYWAEKKSVFLLLKYGKIKVIYYNKNLDNALDRPISSIVYQCQKIFCLFIGNQEYIQWSDDFFWSSQTPIWCLSKRFTRSYQLSLYSFEDGKGFFFQKKEVPRLIDHFHYTT